MTRRGHPRAWRAGAYGVEFSGRAEIRGLSPGGAEPSPGAPLVELELRDRLDPLPQPSAVVAGTPGSLTIERGGGCYRMSAPRLGQAALAPPWRHASITPPSGDSWPWSRWVLSQVLPFVAALHGREQLHGGGVVIDGCAVALVGPSGAGKSTLVGALVDQGASFLADDVLALEQRRRDVLAHPGPGLLVLGGGRILTPCAAAPLRTVCVLEPGPSTAIRAGVDPDPVALLGNVYERVRRDATRLEGQLALLADLATSAQFVRIHRGPDSDPGRLARRLLDHLVSG